LKPVDGWISAAPTSRQSGGISSSSNNRLASRNSASPMNEPPTPVLMRSFADGGVVSPAISHSALPASA
jgi:hypothetical protein